MLNVTIKLVGEEDNQEIQLIIQKDQGQEEELKKFQNFDQDGKVIEGEFYAEFMLNGKQLYVTGSHSQGESDTIIYINSVNGINEGMPGELGLGEEKEEIQVQMLKHPRKQVEELESKIKDLEEQLNNQPAATAALLKEKDEEINTLQGEVTELKAAQQNDGAQLQSEINKQLAESKELVDKLQKENKELEAKNTEAAKLQTDLKAKEEEIAQLKQQQPNAALLQEKDTVLLVNKKITQAVS